MEQICSQMTSIQSGDPHCDLLAALLCNVKGSCSANKHIQCTADYHEISEDGWKWIISTKTNETGSAMCCLPAVTHWIGVNTTEHDVFIQLLGDILISVLQVCRIAHFEESTDILISKAVLEGHKGGKQCKREKRGLRSTQSNRPLG